MSLSIGHQEARDAHAATMHTIVAGEISMAYAAEWHSEVLERLGELGVDFVETIHQQNFRDSNDKSLDARCEHVRAALEEEPGDAQEFLLKVSQQVTDGLLAALTDRSVHLGRTAVDEAAKTAISFIPIVGPFVAQTGQLLNRGNDLRELHRQWIEKS